MECPNCNCEVDEIQITDNGPMCKICNSPPEYDQDFEYQDDVIELYYNVTDDIDYHEY